MGVQVKWTHLALHIRNLDRSIQFYTTYTPLRTIHQRDDVETNMRTAWLSSPTDEKGGEFVLVLLEGDPLQADDAKPQAALGPISHLGFAMESREEVDQIAEQAKQAGILASEPMYLNEHIGYLCTLNDPDGHQVEFSYGQALGEK